MDLVELHNVNLIIDNKSIIENISLKLTRGEITTLIGVNGGGKTTLAKIIIGAIKPTAGRVVKHGKIKIGHMPQQVHIDKTIPIDVINFIKLTNPQLAFNEQFYSWCERLKINDILNQQIHEISGGQLQKILFLQAICDDNDLLILDEPTQFMDFPAVNEFYKIVNEIRNDNNCAVLLISHDLHLVMQKTDMVYCINRHLCCHGKPADIHLHPEYLLLLGDKNSNNGGKMQSQAEIEAEISFYAHRHNHWH